MTTEASPAGLLPLALAFAGGAAIFAGGVAFAIHGASVPVSGLVPALTWGAVALTLGLWLRVPRLPVALQFGIFWLALGIGASAWLWWSQNA